MCIRAVAAAAVRLAVGAPGGDTENPTSSARLPELCVEQLRRQRAHQAAEPLAAGDQWEDSGLVFTTALGTPTDAANVRRDFRLVLGLFLLDPST